MFSKCFFSSSNITCLFRILKKIRKNIYFRLNFITFAQINANNLLLYNYFQLIADRDRLNKDLESQHKVVRVLEEEIEEMVQTMTKSKSSK